MNTKQILIVVIIGLTSVVVGEASALSNRSPEGVATVQETVNRELACGVVFHYQAGAYLVTGLFPNYVAKLDLLRLIDPKNLACVQYATFRSILGEEWKTPCISGTQISIVETQFSDATLGEELKENSIDVTTIPTCESFTSGGGVDPESLPVDTVETGPGEL